MLCPVCPREAGAVPGDLMSLPAELGLGVEQSRAGNRLGEESWAAMGLRDPLGAGCVTSGSSG